MIQADYLFLLTDVDCLYTENPRRFPDTAKPVRLVRDIEALREMVSTATLGSSLGTGGMETKLIAAELATGAGVATIITHGIRPSSILDIVSQPSTISDEDYLAKTPLHTLFLPMQIPLTDRRWWVLHGLKPRGKIIIDEGAYKAIARSSSYPSGQAAVHSSVPSTPSACSTPSSSLFLPALETHAQADGAHSSPFRPSSSSSGNGGRLLPAGVIAVEGIFAAGQAVTVAVQRKKRSSMTSRTNRKGKSAADAREETLNSSENSQPGTPRRKAEHSDEEDTFNTDSGPEGATRDKTEEIERIEFGRGLANYNSQEMDRIKGQKSSQIERLLGYIEAEHCVESITSLKHLSDEALI